MYETVGVADSFFDAVVDVFVFSGKCIGNEDYL